jgi:peroxiredoxin
MEGGLVRPLLTVLLASLLVAACGPSGGEGGVSAGDDASAEEARELAPDFTLNDLTGAPVRLEALRGKTVVLDFWATWCPPCEFQIPILNQVYEAHRDAGDVEILGISVDTEGPDVVKEYIAKHEAIYPIVIGSEALARKFGAPGFPSLIVVDPSGRIADVHVGLIEAPDLEEVIATIQAEAAPSEAPEPLSQPG